MESDTKEIQKFRELLSSIPASDFDGHTEFKLLTPEQKLLWLSQCAQFVAAVKKDK